MYTIKQAAARTGLSIPTIRAWERRYGVVSPSRTPPGYRLYDDAAIERLTAMRSLVETRRLATEPGRRTDRDPRSRPGVTGRAPARRPSAGGDDRPSRRRRCAASAPIDAFVAAAQGLDIDRMERILDEAFAAQRFELAMDAVVFPALRAVGRRMGRRATSMSRRSMRASETVRRRLPHFFDAARGPMTQAQAARRDAAGRPARARGASPSPSRVGGPAWRSPTSGMDVPLESWLRMARETAVPAIVLGAVTSEDAAARQPRRRRDRDAWTIRRSASPAARPRSMPGSTSGAVRLPSLAR